MHLLGKRVVWAWLPSIAIAIVLQNVLPTALLEALRLVAILGLPLAGFILWRYMSGPLGTLPRDLIAARFRVCGQCGYDLRYQPNQGVCPECGVMYDVGLLVPMWRMWIRERATWKLFRVRLVAWTLGLVILLLVTSAVMNEGLLEVITLVGMIAIVTVINWGYAVSKMAKSIPSWDHAAE